jgi:aspartyl-tRNA(Asn)/glutamyl-tRNA(Gln) amidotransferase subunit C
MSLTRDDINSVAKLARLNLSEVELNKYSDELIKIFNYIERLQTIDTKGIEPMIHAFGADKTPTRADNISADSDMSFFREHFFDIAPQTEGTFFKVPKMGDK